MKRLLFVLIVSLLLTSFFSCNNTSDNFDEFEMLLNSAEEQTEPIEPFAQTVYIIIPSNCSGVLSSRAEALAADIEEKTGVFTYVKYDSETVENEAEALEILIGDTSRVISQETVKMLKEGDFLCRFDRGSLVITGKSEESTLLALDKFENDIMPGASRGALMHESAHFEEFSEHNIDAVLLNQFGIYNYSLSCSDDEEVRMLAETLRSYIVKRSGYLIDIRESEEETEEVKKTIGIFLDSSCEEGIAVVEGIEDDVCIRAKSIYALSRAVAEFANMLLPKEAEGDVSLTIEEAMTFRCADQSIDISFAIVNANEQPTFEFCTDLAKDIRKFEGQMLVFLQIDQALLGDVALNCPNDSSLLSFSTPSGQTLPIVYKDSEFLNIDVKNEENMALIKLDEEDGESWTLQIRYDSASGVDRIPSSDNTVVLLCGADGNIEKNAACTFTGESESYAVLLPTDEFTASVGDAAPERFESAFKVIYPVSVYGKYHKNFNELKDALK